MSIESMNWALRQPVSGTKKVVLIGIASHADSEGDNAWPAIATLAVYAHVSPRSVQLAIAELQVEGFLWREFNEGGGKKLPDHIRPNLYRLNIVGKPVPERVKRHSPGAISGNEKQVKPASPPEASFTNPMKPASPPPPEASFTQIVPNELSLELSKKEKSASAPAPRTSKAAFPIPDGIDPRKWADWMLVRKAKRAPMTETAWEYHLSEAAKAGISPNAAVVACCERNWQGFNATWYAERTALAAPAYRPATTQHPHAPSKHAAAAASIWGVNDNGRTIDV